MGGWPPLVLCFEHSYDRDAVLGKAHLLERSPAFICQCPLLMITEGSLQDGDLDNGGHGTMHKGSVGGTEKVHAEGDCS